MDSTSDCPGLIPVDPKNSKYVAMLRIKGRSLKIDITPQRPGSLLSATIDGGPLFRKLKKSIDAELGKLTRSNLPLEELVNQIRILLEKTIPDQPSLVVYENLDTILNELQEIGWQNVVSFSGNASKIKLKHVDPEYRQHEITFTLSPSYPRIPPHVESAIPLELDDDQNSIEGIFKVFKDAAEDLENQSLWAELDEIDNNTLVIGDTKESYYQPCRQIVVAQTVVAYLELIAKSPREIPECYLYGPKNLVDEYKRVFTLNSESWNEEWSVMENLRSAFGVCLPTKYADIKDFNLECGICFSVNDHNSDNVYCSNVNCGKLYHSRCLHRWLSVDGHGKAVGQTLHGNCSYCTHEIHV